MSPEYSLERFLSDTYLSISDKRIHLIISSIKKSLFPNFNGDGKVRVEWRPNFFEKYCDWLEGILALCDWLEDIFKVDLPIFQLFQWR